MLPLLPNNYSQMCRAFHFRIIMKTGLFSSGKLAGKFQCKISFPSNFQQQQQKKIFFFNLKLKFYCQKFILNHFGLFSDSFPVSGFCFRLGLGNGLSAIREKYHFRIKISKTCKIHFDEKKMDEIILNSNLIKFNNFI